MLDLQMTRSAIRFGCLLVGLALALSPLASIGREAPLPAIAAQALPAQARATLEFIRTDGPFPYERDGVVFGNRERILPHRSHGYYHAYTVPTPGLRGRGGRRLVCGGHAADLSECYYSDDHYRSFRKIQP